MRIAFLGTGEFGCPTLRALRDAGHEIVAAISQPDRPAGRGRKIQPSYIHAAADELGIRHIQTADVNVLEPGEAAPNVALGVVVAFGQKIGPAWLHAFPHALINIHASLLPRHRGAAPYQWAILSGDETTGVSVFRLSERWDAGPLLGQRETAIGDLETAEELHDRLALVGAELIVDIVRAIATGTSRPVEQDASLATRAPKLSRRDSAIDFAQPARRVQRRIHGLWSWPAATCLLDLGDGRAERVQLARAKLLDETTAPTEASPPGAIHDDGSVQTGCGRLMLLEVKPAGGKLMPFEAFARGRHITPSMRLRKLELE